MWYSLYSEWIVCVCPLWHNEAYIKKHDVFAFRESWLEPEESCPTIDGYANFRSKCKRKCGAKWNFVGIIICCCKSLVKGATKIKGMLPNTLWLKLDHTFFGVPRDIYLCVANMALVWTSYTQSRDDFTDLTSETQSAVHQWAMLPWLRTEMPEVGVKQETLLAIHDHTKMPIKSL